MAGSGERQLCPAADRGGRGYLVTAVARAAVVAVGLPRCGQGLGGRPG